MKRIFQWKPSFLTSFSLLGAFITIVIAVFFGWSIQKRLEQNALRQEANSTADQVDLVLSPNLEAEDLTAPLPSARFDQIDSLIRTEILHAHIVRVKIWSLDGLLIYSDERDLVGQYYPLSEELEEAIQGEVAMEVSDLDKAENIAERDLYKRLLEFYVPIRVTGSDAIVGVYEIYHDLAVLEGSHTVAQPGNIYVRNRFRDCPHVDRHRVGEIDK